MANDLTGDYDVVAAFSLGAIDRILAAMHRGNRIPHALSMAVDDFPPLRLSATAVSIVDRLGNAVTSPDIVKKTAYSVPAAARLVSEEVLNNVDPVVNWRPDPSAPREIQLGIQGLQGGVFPLPGSSEFSYLSGVAFLQLGPPTMQLGRGETSSADLHTPVMIYYVADAETRPISPFMRGEIVTTFGVQETAAKRGTNIVVNLAGANVHFTPFWSSVTVDADDLAAINKALVKSVRHSFQPSTAPMPSNLRTLHFKGFPGGGPVCALMNVVSNNNPSPGSVGNIFIAPADHFALAVNGDAISGPFAAAVNAAIAPNRFQSTDTTVTITANAVFTKITYTFHIYTNVTVLDASVTLGGNQIVLTIPVQVRFGWKDKPFFVPDPVDFDFTIVQAFTLTLSGREVGIERVGDVAVNIASSVPSDEANPARTQAKDLFNNAWNSQQSAIQQQINKALSADGLQAFLKSLMNPATATPPYLKTLINPSPDTATVEVDPTLQYTWFEIQPAGVVLHGSLSVPAWPAPHSEFDKDPWAPAARPEYRALNSWIPGGTIQHYQWDFVGSGTATDDNRFVTINAPKLLPAATRICLTFSGTRITASGAVSYDPVYSNRVCKTTRIPISKYANLPDLAAGNRPHVIVPQVGPIPEQALQAFAHASPWAAEGMEWNTANYIVHFPEGHAPQLEWLLKALEHSGRTDTATAIVCVLAAQQLGGVSPLAGLMYADDDAAWERLLDVRRRPATVVLNAAGALAWRHDGEIGTAELAAALRTHLGAHGQFFPQFVESPLTVGQISPNFLFETAPGAPLTLRKLAGQPVALVFWKSSSAASMATIGNLHRAFEQPGVEAPVLIAINDGENGEFARGLAAVEQDEVIVVADPSRQISRAYGIDVWPTTVFLDANGIVVDIKFGLISGQDLQTSLGSRPAPSGQPGKEC
jgi:hypothetical protein